MKDRWKGILENDPAYSPNLTLDYEDVSYAWPPRVLAYDSIGEQGVGCGGSILNTTNGPWVQARDCGAAAHSTGRKPSQMYRW